MFALADAKKVIEFPPIADDLLLDVLKVSLFYLFKNKVLQSFKFFS